MKRSNLQTSPKARKAKLANLLTLLLILYLAHEPILFAIGDFLVVQDQLAPADLIHVLGGSLDRVDYGVQLYRQGYGRQLFFTGDSTEGWRRALSQGLDPRRIEPFESTATSTYEEALELKQFLEANSAVESVIVVSSPYHMRRARWVFGKVLADRGQLLFTPVPSDLTGYQLRWWTDQRAARLVIDEYLKVLYYYARY